MKTLLIEDELIAQTIAAERVKSLGCQCDTASTGKEALELINQNTYDFILCDLGLEDMTGFEIARQITQGNSSNKNTPIFALTAHGDEVHEKKAKESGMVHLLKKPLNEATLKGVLDCVAAKTC